MKLEVDVEKIRQEVKLEFYKELQKKFDMKVETRWRQRLVKFDRLFNKIIAKQLQLDDQNAYVKKLEKQQLLNEERMKNPFYVTLKAQKEERDKFIDFYASGAILGLPPTSPTSDGDNKLISFAIESPTSADGNPMIEDD